MFQVICRFLYSPIWNLKFTMEMNKISRKLFLCVWNLLKLFCYLYYCNKVTNETIKVLFASCFSFLVFFRYIQDENNTEKSHKAFFSSIAKWSKKFCWFLTKESYSNDVLYPLWCMSEVQNGMKIKAGIIIVLNNGYVLYYSKPNCHN